MFKYMDTIEKRKIMKKKFWDKSVIKFLAVGGCCTFIDYSIYMMIVDKIGALGGKGISLGCSMIINYLLNKYWSFDAKKTKKGKEITRYILSQVANITVNMSINFIVLSVIGQKTIAFLCATGVAMIVNYLLQRFWVFKKFE
jgi:putative flippase GtrA